MIEQKQKLLKCNNAVLGHFLNSPFKKRVKFRKSSVTNSDTLDVRPLCKIHNDPVLKQYNQFFLLEKLHKATSLFKISVAPANCLIEKVPKGKQR